MPKNFAEIGAKEEDIPKLVRTLCYGDGRTGTIGGFVQLNEDDCTKIYQMMIGNTARTGLSPVKQTIKKKKFLPSDFCLVAVFSQLPGRLDKRQRTVIMLLLRK